MNRNKKPIWRFPETVVSGSKVTSAEVRSTVNGGYKQNKFAPKKKEPEINILTEEYKNTVCSQSYLGKKGYTIPKTALSTEDVEFLRKDLFVKPLVIGISYGDETASFPVFRENVNKMYLPRFYGITRYGLPKRNEIDPGEDINVPFEKPLRDYQDKIIQVYTEYVNKPIVDDASLHNGSGGILEVPCGRGKCLGINTPILMFDGTIRLVQDVKTGDLLMGDDSTPRKVLSLARGREMMYKVVEQTGEGYIVNESHILSLKCGVDLNTNTLKGTIIDMQVTEYLAYDGNSDALLGYRVPVTFKEKKVEIDPYLFGYWLGNGNGFDGYVVETGKYSIPLHYKCNSRKIQLELLAGLVDSAGHYNGNCYEIVHLNETILDDIVFLARSLGFSCVKINKHANICGFGLKDIPIKRIQKKAYPHKPTPDCLTYKIKLEKLQEDDYYGFEIDGNHRFVLGDFTVTHNTVMALKIISLLSKKTLILVHKEFLMNQWIERIGEFLPTARVGKIQGPIFDINNKDIVIGMIQTLYDKEYSANTFSTFGLTIVDEVHRIGSEQFSRTLFKTITPYMLGISATVDRKDKLTRVLHMFIGDKIYTEQRDSDDVVSVRAINYATADPEFNNVELDFRGNTKYSTMITKLCAYGPRSDFVVGVLGDLLKEEPENQIMVLCHNRNLLTYLNEAINHRKLTTVGFYVGGMKQANLQETETKQIVLATYAMAAEALDIKTLSTLVMITPKTDIIQSVGRILRVKHDNPIIVDIVDAHDIFQNQWTQRRRFYKKCNYRIRQIDSKQYAGMSLDWDKDLTWKRVFEPKIESFTAGCVTPNNNNSLSLSDSDDGDGESVHLKPIAGSNAGKCLIDISMFDGL